MQGIAGILGGKGGGAGSGAPVGAAEPPGRAQPVRAVPAGKGPLRGWVGGGRVHGGGRCGELVCAWGAAPAEGAGGQAWAGRAVKPAGGVGAGGGGPAGPPRPKAGAEGAAAGRPRKPPGGRLALRAVGRGYAGAGRESVPCTGRQAARALQKTLHNFTKLSPVFTEDKKLCQVLFTICGYNGCQ